MWLCVLDVENKKYVDWLESDSLQLLIDGSDDHFVSDLKKKIN